MERQGPRAALILALLLSCSPAPTRGGGAAGGLEVTTELDAGVLRPSEGDLATVVFRIKNGGSNYIVLRDLTYLADPSRQESASAAASWQIDQEGKLSYVAESNEWKYERPRRKEGERRERTPAVFNTGLLVPAETITVRTRLRLLGLPKFFQLLYFELPLEKVRSDVYFETRQDRDVRFRAMIGEDLKARLTPDPKTEAGGHRTVLYPFAERVEPTAKLKPLKVEAELLPRAFPLDQAIRKSGGGPAEQHTYCAALGAWVIKRGAEFSMVTPLAVTPLPLLRQMDRTFFFIDSRGVEKIEIELQDDAVASVMQLEKKYPVVVSKQPPPTRFFLFVAPSDLPRFFADARSANFALDVEILPEGGGRLRLLR